LLKNSNFQNLTTLILTNNQITELPANIETLARLEYFDIGNYMGEDRQTCNRLRGSSLDKMLEHKWDALKTLTV
jgi:Leucine-rich repeat (LRR) protein